MTSALHDRRVAAHLDALLAWAARRLLDVLGLSIRLQVANGTTATASGEREAARHAGGTFDAARIVEYVRTVSDGEAKAIVRALEKDPASSRWEDFEDRAPQIAETHAASALNFGTHEFGHQQPFAMTKTWRTRSGNPRATHAALDGVTVGMDDVFANSLRFPADPSGPIEEVAGCRCILQIQRGDTVHGDR